MHYDPFKEKLQKTLEQYEHALEDPEGFKTQKEREIAEKMVNDIKSQLAKIERARQDGNETEKDIRSMIKSISTSVEDRRVRGMKEIFGFYSRQHLPEGLGFDDILNKQNFIDLGEFLLFRRDFEIPLDKKKSIEIFKKTSKLRQLPINFEEFCEAVDKIGIEINHEKIASIKKRLKEIKKIEKEQGLISPQRQKELEDKLQKEVEKQKAEEDEKDIQKHESVTNRDKTEGQEDKDKTENDKSDNENKTKTEVKTVTGKTSQSGADDDSDDSESKSKTTGKTGKTGKSDTKGDPTSKDEDSDSDGTASRPLSMKSKNKSVRFSTVGNSRLKQTLEEVGDNAENRSLDLIEEEGLEIHAKPSPSVNPIFIEKERLERELQKYEAKTVEDCHDDIMNLLEVHDPQKFRKKAKGVLEVPFAIKKLKVYPKLSLKPDYVYSQDFYYKISNDFEVGHKKKSKLSAAQIKAKVEEMKMRREHEKWVREKQAEKARKQMDDAQEKKLERQRQQKINTASKQRKIYVDGQSVLDENASSYTESQYQKSPTKDDNKNSYRLRKNKAKGLPPEEGKNTKVTLELLQKIHYQDIEQSMKDDFKPEMVTDEENEEDDSVFNYFFPGNKNKKPKKVKGENYSEKIMNMKKEYNTKDKMIRGNHDVIFEDQESMYKSEKETNKAPKSHRSIQPSNPGQSKKSHRRVESQINLHSSSKDLLKSQKGMTTGRKSAKDLNPLVPSSTKKYTGALTSRKEKSDHSRSRSKSKDKSKLKKSNQKSHILNQVAKIEDMKRRKDKDNLNRAMKIHNNQLRKSQKYIK